MVKVARKHFYNIHDLCIANAEPYTREKHLRIKRLKLRQKAQHNKEKHEAYMFEYYHVLFKEYLISLLDTLKFLRDNGVDLNKVIDIAVNDDNGLSEYCMDVLVELNRILNDEKPKDDDDVDTELNRIRDNFFVNYNEGDIDGQDEEGNHR